MCVGMAGFSDPYVEVSFGGGEKKKTSVCRRSLFPIWNQTLELPVQVAFMRMQRIRITMRMRMRMRMKMWMVGEEEEEEEEEEKDGARRLSGRLQEPMLVVPCVSYLKASVPRIFSEALPATVPLLWAYDTRFSDLPVI